jgi:hypothetical protein
MNAVGRLGRICGGGILLLSAACTTVTITPDAGTSAPATIQSYRSVVLGPVDVRQAEFSYLTPFFREGFVRRLIELKAFDTVSDNPANPPGSGTLVVTATLTEVEKGDAVLRFMVGMGAGREFETAHLIAKAADGNTVGSFDVRKAYSGGMGIGGASFLDIEDLTKQVGEQAAQSLVDWSQGKLTASN